MTQRALTRQQSREIDRRAAEEFGLHGLVLMENAGRGAANFLIRQGIAGSVHVCCGGGNNAGDGFVMARHLEAAGHSVIVQLFADPASIGGDALANFRVLRHAGTPLRIPGESCSALDAELQQADWVVDALLGTGIRGTVRERSRMVIDAINRSGRRVLAVDLPSGMDCDTGLPCGACVRASSTATFVAPKSGFTADGAADLTGTVEVIDIGIPRKLLTSYGL